MRYAGGAPRDRAGGPDAGHGAAARALAVPDGPGRPSSGTRRPSTASARPSPTPSSSRSGPASTSTRRRRRSNAGRLLSAGFHIMTGYFRDDAPALRADPGRGGPARARPPLAGVRLHHRRPDAAVLELHLVRARPSRRLHARPRVRLRPRRGQGRGVRGQDRAAGRGLPGEGPPDRGERRRRSRRSRTTSRIISASIRRVEQDRPAAEPSHLEALQAFAERAYRRPLSTAERDGVARLLPHAPREGRAEPRGGRPRHARQRPDVAALLLPRRPRPARARASGRSRITPWPAG